MTTKIKRE